MSKLFLYNTLTRKKEEFKPIDDKQVKIYSCGPTVYSDPHIGNFKSMCFSDLLRNTIKHIAWYPVFQVMNITDVGHLVSDGDEGEDKMEKWAKKEGLSVRDIAKKYEKKFKDAMQSLHVEPFDVMPRATDHIQEQIDLIKSLEEQWYTYKLGDGIYFDTSKLEDYGKLLGPNYKKHIAGLKWWLRIKLNGKKNPTDFALWKFSSPWEKRAMERDSPRGRGFPGWHIECSAMSHKYLGDHFDIHVGGPEHIAVHHSNEIAQSECGYQLKDNWVNYWIHHGVLTVDGWKMSKSLGNGYTLQQLAEQDIDPLDLRMFYFTAHYRSYQDFTWERLQAVQKSRLRIRTKIQHAIEKNNWKADQNTAHFKDFQKRSENTFRQEIQNALLDDLNTVKVLALINKKLQQDINTNDLEVLYLLERDILKLDLFVPLQESDQDIPQEIKDLAEQRLAAKKEKDYSLADDLRNQIQDTGYAIKDTPQWYEITII